MNRWRTLGAVDVAGLQGARLDLWRKHRLWYLAESGYLIDGFENRPGVHPWQGEHLGKWLHAATLAWVATRDEKLKAELARNVERLLATQLADGYLGTYAPESTFVAKPENVPLAEPHDDTDPQPRAPKERKRRFGWDVWTHRYNLYGLLTFEAVFPNERVVDACRRMADLLIEVYGEDGADITKYGTRKGISATTLLESMVMLHERTGEAKYLDFAEHIVRRMEANPGLRLMSTLRNGGSVVGPGEGKGYQLMANLLGYLRLYGCTGKREYLDTAINGWTVIRNNHILVTGGPWTRHMPYNGNRECFAHTRDFDPWEVSVEGCCDATWIQLCLHLFELLGDSAYLDAAEVTLYNSLHGHQHADGVRWCYFTAPNEVRPVYADRITCCASSMPRGMEMMADHLVGEIDGHLSIGTLAPCTVALGEAFGGGTVIVDGDFPAEPSAAIRFEGGCGRAFTCEFRLPAGTRLSAVRVNGTSTEVTVNERGFHELHRRWESGDVLAIEAEFELHTHIQSGEGGQQWVAFTRGPIALAQRVSAIPDEEPFDGRRPEAAQDMLAESADGSLEIAGTGLKLMPYLLTCADDSGPKTYFRCGPRRPVDERALQ
ncbi:MAG: hypothetical protein F4X98_09850 [Gammaproteobacteria bacterium]|nr:hypothetical protein [Gammaproteobacteria bacterium]